MRHQGYQRFWVFCQKCLTLQREKGRPILSVMNTTWLRTMRGLKHCSAATPDPWLRTLDTTSTVKSPVNSLPGQKKTNLWCLYQVELAICQPGPRTTVLVVLDWLCYQTSHSGSLEFVSVTTPTYNIITKHCTIYRTTKQAASCANIIIKPAD